MLFVLLAVLGGVLAGLALGGSFGRLASTPLRWTWLLAAAVLVQLVGAFTVSGTAYAALLAASLVLAVGFLAGNRALAGRVLLGAGLALNALVVGLNGAMPVSLAAAASAGVQTGSLAADPRHVVAGPATHLAVLEDRIGLALPWQPQVLSAGDVLVAAGAALLVAQAMRRRVAAPGPLTTPRPVRPPWPPQAKSEAPTIPPA